MPSFSLTSSGLTYTNSDGETRGIVIDEATDTISFGQLEISTPSVTTVAYSPAPTPEEAAAAATMQAEEAAAAAAAADAAAAVNNSPPIDISGNYSDAPYWSGAVITQAGSSVVFTHPGSIKDGDTLTITGSTIVWNEGTQEYGVTGTFANNIITWSDGNTWERAATVDPDLVAYWPLTTITNGTTPDVVHGYDMNVTNMTAANIVTGRTGGSSLAFLFDSQSSTVLSRTDTASHPLPIGKQTDYTISYWLKMIVTGTHFSFANTGNDGLMVAKHDGNPFHTFHGNSTQGSHQIQNPNSFGNPADGSWHHVSLTKSAGYIYKIYIDGVLTKTHSHGSSIVLDVDTTSIGAQRETIGHMDGEMSEVAVWKRALSASEGYRSSP
jgi:hypothetical protein